MSVTTAQAVTLLENVLFESPTIAQANAASWVSQSATSDSLSSVAGLAAAMAATPEAEIAQQVVRYYMGALGRVPAGNEIQFYINVVEAGLTADQLAQGASAVSGTEWAQIAAYFAASPEFTTDFGLTTAGQVDSSNEAQVIFAFYANILGRVPNAAEVTYYQTLLNSGTSVSTLVQYFTTSPEYQSTVDANIAKALGDYGTDVVGGTTPPSIPLTPPGLALGSTPLTVNGTLNMTAVNVTGAPATAGQTAQTAVTGVIGVAGVTAATGVQGVTAVTAVAPVAGRSAVTAVTDGAVTINDISSGASGAGVIKSVTLSNSGAGSVINDNGLTSLTLVGTTGTLAITNLNSTAISAHASSLALVVNGLSAAANTITDTNNEIATLSVTTTSVDSVLAGFTDTHLTTLNVAGSNKLTLLSTNSSLTALNVTGAASFSDGATTHTGGLAALGAHLTITDSSTGTFAAALDDTTQTFTGGAGVDIITVSALADATKTLTAGSATAGNEIIFEGGGYALSSASSGKFVNFQTVGVAANVTGTLDLSVVDPTATGLEVIGANSGVTFSKAAKGAGLLLDPSSGATVTVTYADSTGASDSVKVTLSSAVASLTLQDSAGVGVGTVSIENDLGAADTNVSPAHVISTLTDNGLSTLNVAGAAGLSITTLNEASTPSTSFTLNDASTNGYGVTIGAFTDTALATLAFAGAGTSTISALNTSAASLAVTDSGTTLDYVGTITDNTLTSLSLAANISLGQASSALSGNGLQDGSTAGVTVSGGSDNAHVTVNLTNGAASGKTDAITLGNGNNVVVDASTAGTVTVTLGSGANLVELGGAALNTTAKFSVTFAARTATAPNATFVGAAGTTYNSAPNLVISGATTGDIIAFGNDSLSSNTALTATSLTGASSVATAITTLEAAAITAHKVVYGVYGGNTYIVESATGTVGVTDTAVIEVVGTQTLTASTGYVTLGSTASTLSTGGLSGAGFTIPAGTPTSLSLGAGSNIVTLTGPSAGITDTFTSVSASSALVVNYQATSGTDTINMSGSAGANASDIAALTVNDTSTGSAGVTMGAFTDTKLTSVTYNNSAAVNGAVLTQQAVTSSTLNTINFTGGVTGRTTNSYFFTGTLSTSGTLTINDSNIGIGTATMGLTLAGGPSALAINMTSPGLLTVGTLSDNNLASITIAGSGLGAVTIGTLTDTMTGSFTVTDTGTSNSSLSTIALAGLSAATSLTVNDSAIANLTDSSAYKDSNLATLNLKNTGTGTLTIGGGGISADAVSAVTITGASTGVITTGILSIAGNGSLTIADSSTSSGLTTLPLDNVSGITALTVNDTASGGLTLGNLNDASLTSLSLTNTGSGTLTLGTVHVDGLNTFNITLGGTAAITLGSITDGVAGPVTVNDSSTSASATTLTFNPLTGATSFTVNDAAKGALTIAALTANSAANLTFNNTSSALLTATVTDNTPTVTVTLGGSGTGSDIILLTSTAASAVTIVDTSSSTGASNVTPTLTGGPASFSVSDSGLGTLTIAAVADDNLATISLSATRGLLNATSFTSAVNGTLTSLSFDGTGGTISTVVSAVNDTAATFTITDTDAGSASIGGLLIGAATTNTNSLVAHNGNTGSGTLSIASGPGNTDYLSAITLDNTSNGSISSTLADGVTGTVNVTLSGTGAQTLNLTDIAGQVQITQLGASVNTAITLNHNAENNDSIVLGNGNNSVVLNDTTLSDVVHVTFGTGTNAITLNSGGVVRTAGSLFTLTGASSSNTNTTPVTADSITHFLLDTAAVQGDALSLGAPALLTTAQVDPTSTNHWTVNTTTNLGIMTNSNATVLNFIAAVQGAGAAGIAGFVDTAAGNSWIAYTDGAHNVGVIELIGTVIAGLETSGAALNYAHYS